MHEVVAQRSDRPALGDRTNLSGPLTAVGDGFGACVQWFHNGLNWAASKTCHLFLPSRHPPAQPWAPAFTPHLFEAFSNVVANSPPIACRGADTWPCPFCFYINVDDVWLVEEILSNLPRSCRRSTTKPTGSFSVR